MADTPNEPNDDGLNLIEQVVKQERVDWGAVADLAKHRARDSKKKRKKVLALLTTARDMIGEVKDDLTPAELTEAQDAVVDIAQALDSIANGRGNALLPKSPAS